MKTPNAALDALLSPPKLTLGQVALLEKINSPLVLPTEGEPAAYDLIPSLYLLTLTAAEGATHLPTLQADALAWADSLTPVQYLQALKAASAAIQNFYNLLPAPEEGAKKASPATAG